MQKKIDLRELVLASLFAVLTAVGAFIRIPTGISSVTLQFMFTALSGTLLGARSGALSQLIYVLLGLLGLPVFTAGGGFSYVLNPTFGFLLGLIPSAWLIGRMAESSRSIRSVCIACLAGLGVLYAIGLPYMYIILNFYMKRNLTIGYVLYAGMLIFLPGDFLKIIITAIVTNKIPKGLGQTKGK
ncbi:MAG: biotin transporter BioY [Oscillospiraceae bacterium]|jgi:biotin transport system substrate-specific component